MGRLRINFSGSPCFILLTEKTYQILFETELYHFLYVSTPMIGKSLVIFEIFLYFLDFGI